MTKEELKERSRLIEQCKAKRNQTGSNHRGKTIKNNLKCIYQNCRSVKNKIYELDIQISSQNFDIILLSETWLQNNDNHLSYLKSSTNYHIIQVNRDTKFKSKGGGVALMLKHGISYKTLDFKAILGIDIIVVDCTSSSHNNSIRLILVSRPPCSKDIQTRKLIKTLQKFSQGNVIIVGDFNFSNNVINWHNSTAVTNIGKDFFEFTLNFNYTNIIDTPTHSKGSILDLILLNNPNIVTTTTVTTGLSTSDHFSIEFTIDIPRPKLQTIQYRDFTHIHLLNSYLITNFNRLYENFYISDKYNYLINLITKLMDIHTPIRLASTKPNKTYYPNHIKKLINTKKKIFTEYKKHNISLSKYQNIAKTIKHIINRYNSQRIKNLVSNPNKMFKFFSNLTQKHPPISCIEYKSKFIFDDREKANIFASLFSKSFSNVPEYDPTELVQHNISSTLEDFDFSILDIDNILKTLPNTNCASADQISYKILKSCHSILSPFLSDIFRESLDSGNIPDIWKISYITPIHKKGPKTDPNNYRPITITSAVSRVMERLILKQVLDHLYDNNIITDNQFGFLKKRSSTSQLLSTLNLWYKSILGNKIIDCIYIDIRARTEGSIDFFR
uniref:Reverse transcriptase domain-containing protein n=1 Tax=Meloidogyne hapla TaxID=6305 RepID=A0A1I8B4S4_MELHA